MISYDLSLMRYVLLLILADPGQSGVSRSFGYARSCEGAPYYGPSYSFHACARKASHQETAVTPNKTKGAQYDGPGKFIVPESRSVNQYIQACEFSPSTRNRCWDVLLPRVSRLLSASIRLSNIKSLGFDPFPRSTT
jgi:hypothetical protein